MGISLNIIKDQSLSVDVEAWLSVNKPKVFKMGEMKDNSKHFQRIGSSNKTVHENIALEKENEIKIIEKNKRIRSNRVPSKDLSNRLLIQKKATREYQYRFKKAKYL